MAQAPVSEAPDAQPRRAEILHAANRAFAHYGYRRTSLNEIAREAGLSRTLLYHYFANKEDIFRACVEDLHEQAVARARAAASGDGDLRQRLTAVLEAKLGWFHDLLHRDKRHGAEITDAAGRQAGDLATAGGRAFEAVLAELLAAADAAGELDLSAQGSSPAALASFLHDAGYGLSREHGAWLSGRAYRARLRQLATLTLGGLGWRGR